MTLCDRNPTTDPLPTLQPRLRVYPGGSLLDQLRTDQLSGNQKSTSQSTVNPPTIHSSIEQLKEWISHPTKSQQTLLRLIQDLPLKATVALTMEELKQLAIAIESLTSTTESFLIRQRCRQWQAQTTQEIQQRQTRHQALQTILQQNLQDIQALNPRLYSQELADFQLEPLLNNVLDGKEQQVQQELADCCAAMNRFYEDYKLIRLARISCKVQEAKWILKRTTIACRVFPLIGLIIASFFLHLSMDWLQAIALTLLMVTPLMLWITHSMKREMKERAKQDLEQRKGLLYGEWQRLNDQETQVRDRCAMLLTPAAIEYEGV